MIPYTIYEVATGRIVISGRGLEDDARAHIGDGQAILFQESDWRTQYVAGGELCSIPSAPDDRYQWDWQTKAWQLKDLTDLRAAKWEEMKLAREAAAQAPLLTPYGVFDADTESANNIIRTAQLMQTEAQTLAPGASPTDEFTLADNSVVELTAGQMVEVALLLAAQIKAAFSRGREVRNAIESAANAGDLAAISWLP